MLALYILLVAMDWYVYLTSDTFFRQLSRESRTNIALQLAEKGKLWV